MKKYNLLKRIMLTSLMVSAFYGLTYSQTWNQIGNDIDGEVSGDASGYSVSLSSDGSIVAIGAYGNSGNGTSSGHVRIFENLSGSWNQIGNDIDGEAAFDESGKSVSLNSDGSVVAIGARNNAGNGHQAGHVRIYEYISGIWTQIGNDIDGEAVSDQSGIAVSLNADGSVVAIGAPHNDGSGSDAGHVRIYKNVSGIWMQVGEDIDAEGSGNYFGYSVSLSADGSRVAIGGPGSNGGGWNSGHVRVFENQADSWIQIGNSIYGEAMEDESGVAVSLNSNGTIVAIGAWLNDGNGEDAGHVRVFEYQTGSWIQIGSNINGEMEYDKSGIAVSLNSEGSIVAVGSEYNNGNGTSAGHVRIFENQLGNWIQLGGDIDGEAAGDRCGISVSLNSDGSKIAIGAWGNDGNGPTSGHTRVFEYGLPTNIPTEYTNTEWPLTGKIFIYNINGQLVAQREINSSIINLNFINPGVYIIKIQSGNTVISKKVYIRE